PLDRRHHREHPARPAIEDRRDSGGHGCGGIHHLPAPATGARPPVMTSPRQRRWVAHLTPTESSRPARDPILAVPLRGVAGGGPRAGHRRVGWNPWLTAGVGRAGWRGGPPVLAGAPGTFAGAAVLLHQPVRRVREGSAAPGDDTAHRPAEVNRSAAATAG